jgi:hypothetical protein
MKKSYYLIALALILGLALTGCSLLSNIQQEYLETWPETGMAYISYEDATNGDFDYNDFGMDMSVIETYSYLGLEEIQMTFIGRLKLAEYQHRIHLAWSDSVTGDVHVEYFDAGGSPTGTHDSSFTGSVDIVVFDDTNYVIGDTTLVHITFDAPATSSILPPPYDPYMFLYDTGQTFHIGDTQFKDMPVGSADLPYILVIPVTWAPPAEGNSIWTVYGNFDDFYVNGSPVDWYETFTGPNPTI